MQEMSSAILLSSVLIQVEFIPSGELIMSEQKNRATEFEKTLSPDLDLIVSLFGQT